jgi:hypothetical protein
MKRNYKRKSRSAKIRNKSTNIRNTKKLKIAQSKLKDYRNGVGD